MDTNTDVINDNTTSDFDLAIIGLGFVGEAIHNSFKQKISEVSTDEHQVSINNIYVYDKYKYGCGVGNLKDTLKADIIFLALPTVFSTEKLSYDKYPIIETLKFLCDNNYGGSIVIKSTIEPTESNKLSNVYKHINLIHNPEFLTARTAAKDFHYQKHIVMGKTSNCSLEAYHKVIRFYESFYPDAEISQCSSTESECMKIFCNNFYATKVQLFNEFYLVTQELKKTCDDEKHSICYDEIVKLMVRNGWINKMHMEVPGPDGKLSYGGACFPKDTNALNGLMSRSGTCHSVIEAVIKERDSMREDNSNVI